MREALAGTDHDFLAREGKPARAARRGKTTILRRLLRHARRQPGAVIILGCFVAAAIGVPLNALYFQDGRHPAPLFRAVAEAPEPGAAAQARVVTGRVPMPPARPADIGPRAVPAAEAKPEALRSGDDPIRRLLDGKEAKSDASFGSEASVLAAQRALVELGYLLRADGRLGAATRQAIEKFERDIGFPATGFLTPEITRQISARAGTPVERPRGGLR